MFTSPSFGPIQMTGTCPCLGTFGLKWPMTLVDNKISAKKTFQRLLFFVVVHPIQTVALTTKNEIMRHCQSKAKVTVTLISSSEPTTL